LTEFAQRYAKLKRSERVKVREQMIVEAIAMMPMHVKGNSTDRQCRAAARKKVDIAMSLARKVL
jgi:hypothetical protein